MSANVIRLKPRPKPLPTNIRSEAVKEVLAGDPGCAFFDGMRVRLLLEDLRAHQDMLLSVIENLRAPSLRAHPNFGCPAADLEATSIQALAEVGLLIRQGTVLLQRHEKAEV